MTVPPSGKGVSQISLNSASRPPPPPRKRLIVGRCAAVAAQQLRTMLHTPKATITTAGRHGLVMRLHAGGCGRCSLGGMEEEEACMLQRLLQTRITFRCFLHVQEKLCLLLQIIFPSMQVAHNKPERGITQRCRATSPQASNTSAQVTQRCSRCATRRLRPQAHALQQ